MIRAGKPGTGRRRFQTGLLEALFTAMGAGVLFMAAPDERLALVMGTTWASCAFKIASISVPTFVGVLWAMKGLMSAALGALVYALHYPEMQVPFLAVWYVLDLLMPTTVGTYRIKSAALVINLQP